MDWFLATIGLLLIVTLGAFFLKLTPYPVGAALLLVLFVFRLKKMNSKCRYYCHCYFQMPVCNDRWGSISFFRLESTFYGTAVDHDDLKIPLMVKEST